MIRLIITVLFLSIFISCSTSTAKKSARETAVTDPYRLVQGKDALCNYLVEEMFKKRKDQASPKKDCLEKLQFKMGKLLTDPRVPTLYTGMIGSFTWKYIDDFTTNGQATFLKKIITKEDASIEGDEWYVSKSKKDVKYFTSKPFLDKIIENTDFHRGNASYKRYDTKNLDAKVEFDQLEQDLKNQNECLFTNIDKTKDALNVLDQLDVDVDMEDILDLQRKGKLRRIILRKYVKGPYDDCLYYKFKLYTKDGYVLTMLFNFIN